MYCAKPSTSSCWSRLASADCDSADQANQSVSSSSYSCSCPSKPNEGRAFPASRSISPAKLQPLLPVTEQAFGPAFLSSFFFLLLVLRQGRRPGKYPQRPGQEEDEEKPAQPRTSSRSTAPQCPYCTTSPSHSPNYLAPNLSAASWEFRPSPKSPRLTLLGDRCNYTYDPPFCPGSASRWARSFGHGLIYLPASIIFSNKLQVPEALTSS
jgi:hypothetical protein